MLTNKFSLGFRIPNDLAVEDAFALMFDAVPYEHLIGCRILLANPPQNETLPYGSRIIVWDGFALSQARKAYQSAVNCLPWMAILAADTPVLEKNCLVQCEEVAALGVVQENGSLIGGDGSFGRMAFVQRNGNKLAGTHRYLVIGEEKVCKKAAVALSESGRVGSIGFIRLPNQKGEGLVSCLVQGLNGRYLNCGGSGYLGILPDGSVVVDSAADQGDDSTSVLMQRIHFSLEHGYRKICFPGFEATLSDKLSELISNLDMGEDRPSFTVMADDSVACPDLENFKILPAMQTILEWTAFTKKLKSATHLVAASQDDPSGLLKQLLAIQSKAVLMKKHILEFKAETNHFESYTDSRR